MPTFHIQNKKRNRKKSALLFVCLCFAVYRQPQFFFVCFFFLFKNKPFAINQPVRDHIVSVFWKNVCCVFFWIIWPVFLFCVLYCCACVCYISIIMLVNTKIRYSCWWRDSIFYLFSFFFSFEICVRGTYNYWRLSDFSQSQYGYTFLLLTMRVYKQRPSTCFFKLRIRLDIFFFQMDDRVLRNIYRIDVIHLNVFIDDWNSDGCHPTSSSRVPVFMSSFAVCWRQWKEFWGRSWSNRVVGFQSFCGTAFQYTEMNGNKRCPRGGFLFFLNSQVIWRPSLPQRREKKKFILVRRVFCRCVDQKFFVCALRRFAFKKSLNIQVMMLHRAWTSCPRAKFYIKQHWWVLRLEY